jgi:hypothetical protein
MDKNGPGGMIRTHDLSQLVFSALSFNRKPEPLKKRTVQIHPLHSFSFACSVALYHQTILIKKSYPRQ